MDSKVINKNIKSSFFSRRKKERDSFEFWVKSTFIAMLSLIILLLIYYVWILNVNATKGYDIRELEREKRELSIEKELLDVKLAELESLSNISSEDDLENMEDARNPEYLVIKTWVQYVYNN